MSTEQPGIDVDRAAENAAALAFEHAADWLRDAGIAIDESYGEGAAGEHPVLVAGFMIACAIAYHAEADWLRLALEVEK